MASYYDGHPQNPQQRDNRPPEPPYMGPRSQPAPGGRPGGPPMSLVRPQDEGEGSVEEVYRAFPPGSTAGYRPGYDDPYGDPYGGSSVVPRGDPYRRGNRPPYDDRRSLSDRSGWRSRSAGGRDRYGDYHSRSHTTDRHGYRSK